MKSGSARVVSSRRVRKAANRRKSILPVSLIIAGSVLVLIVLVLLSVNATSAVGVSRVKIGAPLGNFTLNDLNGNPVRLSDYAGRPVLINAWATWCPPCRAEMPTLNQYYQAHKKDGLVILAVNAGDPQSSAAEFASSNGITFSILLDPNTRLLDALGINDFPTSVLVGKDGVVRTIHVGMFTEQSLDSEITPLLQ